MNNNHWYSGSVLYYNKMVKTVNAEGVIHHSLQFYHPYILESMPVEGEFEKVGIPYCVWKLIMVRKISVSLRHGSRHLLNGSIKNEVFRNRYRIADSQDSDIG
jgi:hypothetical protein